MIRIQGISELKEIKRADNLQLIKSLMKYRDKRITGSMTKITKRLISDYDVVITEMISKL